MTQNGRTFLEQPFAKSTNSPLSFSVALEFFRGPGPKAPSFSEAINGGGSGKDQVSEV